MQQKRISAYRTAFFDLKKYNTSRLGFWAQGSWDKRFLFGLTFILITLYNLNVVGSSPAMLYPDVPKFLYLADPDAVA